MIMSINKNKLLIYRYVNANVKGKILTIAIYFNIDTTYD